MAKSFYVIEYIDSEGDQVVKHAVLEPEEAELIVRKMAESGMSGSVSTSASGQSAAPIISEHAGRSGPIRDGEDG